MSKPNLEEKYIEFIKNAVDSIVENAKVYIFDSHTEGTTQKYSNVDIALDTKHEIDITEILKLKSVFRNSTFPYKVNIVDLNSADNNFIKVIEKDLHRI